MRVFASASRDNSHNILPAWLRMSVKSLWYNAPGETRTPNLLIRSQMWGEAQPPELAVLRTEPVSIPPHKDRKQTLTPTTNATTNWGAW